MGEYECQVVLPEITFRRYTVRAESPEEAARLHAIGTCKRTGSVLLEAGVTVHCGGGSTRYAVTADADTADVRKVDRYEWG